MLLIGNKVSQVSELKIAIISLTVQYQWYWSIIFHITFLFLIVFSFATELLKADYVKRVEKQVLVN